MSHFVEQHEKSLSDGTFMKMASSVTYDKLFEEFLKKHQMKVELKSYLLAIFCIHARLYIHSRLAALVWFPCGNIASEELVALMCLQITGRNTIRNIKQYLGIKMEFD